MLFPQANQFRRADRLPDLWEFRFDPDDTGRDAGWSSGFDGGRPIAVPASWNDQFAEGRDDLGPAWYQVRFLSGGVVPGRWARLHFGAVAYQADVWLNGVAIGSHRSGNLPFELDIDSALVAGENLLVVRVDGRLDRTTVPDAPSTPAEGTGTPEGHILARMATMMRSFPASSVDFFPWSGIHRPVTLTGANDGALEVLEVDARADRTATVRVWCGAGGDAVRVSLAGTDVEATASLAEGRATLELDHPGAELWGIGAPNLETLVVEVMVGGDVIDRYRTEIGFRTIEVVGTEIHLNGEPIEIRGFGRHEDFPVHGRGYDPAVMVKDFSLLEWIGANSFRASHYPYAEEQLQLADRLGVLVISEAPAVSTSFKDDGDLDARMDQWRADIDALIARDRNHASVVMWSVGNEPFDFDDGAPEYIAEMVQRARDLDPTRPAFIESPISHRDEAWAASDVAALHEYPGWYSDQGRLEVGVAQTRRKVESLAATGKPVIITEIGADTIPGHHALPAEMFSEEYQVELVERVMDLVDEIPGLVGVQWWNLCDFKTAQGTLRPKALNHKGLFTRERRPKAAAHAVRARWTAD